MNSVISKAIAFGLLMGIGATAGCSSDSKGPAQSQSEEMGAVGVQLTLPGGESLNTVNWQVLSGTTVVQSGVVNVANSQTVSFLIGGLGAGSYTLNLTGTSTDGVVTCAGSSAFTVTARQTAQVSINLQCSTPIADAGSVSVVTTLNNCATWQSIVASPSEVNVGSSVTLSASATAPNTSGITYLWSAPSGTFGSATASSTTFTSTVAGPVTVTLLVGDGPVASGFTCSPALDTTTLSSVTFDATSDAGSASSGAASSGAASSGAASSGAASSGAASSGSAGSACDTFKASEALAIGGACTPTETALFNKASSCFDCLLNNGCLDDSGGDSNQECQDTSSPTECVAALSCDITGSPAPAAGNIVNAYCGVGTTTATCEASATAATAPGACAAVIAAGFPAGDTPTQIVTGITGVTAPAGVADGIVACGIGNGCGSCTQ